MQTVQNFLERFQKFIPQETKTKRFVIDCVEGIYGIKLDKTNIVTSGFQITITGNSALRSVLRTKQDVLRSCLAEKIGYEPNLII